MAEVDKTINNLYNKAMTKKQRIKVLEDRFYNETGKSEINSLISSNKIILKKFISKFNAEIELIEKTSTLESRTIDNNNHSVSYNPLNPSTNIDTHSNIQITNQSISNDIKEISKTKVKLTETHLSKIIIIQITSF